MQVQRISPLCRRHLHISTDSQRLDVLEYARVIATFPISTSPLGIGFAEGSLQTPSGRFLIVEKIGHGLPLDTIFKGRIPLRKEAPDIQDNTDGVISRILRLHGLDVVNSNTLERYIYIHGTNHPDLIGTPSGHGCIRLTSSDVARLFELVAVGTPVDIE